MALIRNSLKTAAIDTQQYQEQSLTGCLNSHYGLVRRCMQ